MNCPKTLLPICFVLFAAGLTFLGKGVAGQAPGIKDSPT
jgi:hypothetical protein